MFRCRWQKSFHIKHNIIVIFFVVVVDIFLWQPMIFIIIIIKRWWILMLFFLLLLQSMNMNWQTAKKIKFIQILFRIIMINQIHQNDDYIFDIWLYTWFHVNLRYNFSSRISQHTHTHIHTHMDALYLIINAKYSRK